MIKILNELIEIDVPTNEKAFIAIGTKDIETWAIEGSKPFVIPLTTKEDFDRFGIDSDEYDMCCQLEIGQMTNDFDYLGVYVMRIQ